jgi:hypothetical protein
MRTRTHRADGANEGPLYCRWMRTDFAVSDVDNDDGSLSGHLAEAKMQLRDGRRLAKHLQSEC